MEHSKVFSAIQAAYPKLTAAERSVADFFLQNRERGDFSSKAVAARLYVSEASLSRFAQKCGFKGYREFIYEYQRPFDEGSPFLSFSQVTKDVLARYQQLLDSSSRLVDEGQMRRVSQMLANSQRVYIYGMGSSGFAAREFALRLMRTGLLAIPTIELAMVATIPAPFSTVMFTGDMRGVIWWAVCLAVDLLIWYPFFKTYEKQEVEKEAAEALAKA